MTATYKTLAVLGAMLTGFFLVAPFALADTIISSQNDYVDFGTNYGVTNNNALFNVQYFNKANANDNISIIVVRPKSLPAGTYAAEVNNFPFGQATYDGVSPLFAIYTSSTTVLQGFTCAGTASACNFDIRGVGTTITASTSVSFYGTTTTPVIDHTTGGTIYQVTGSAPQILNLTSLFFSVYTGNGFGTFSTTTPLTPQSSFGFSTSTISSFCGSNATTTTSWLSGLANDFSYGLCYSFAFLFVPSAGSLNQFSELQPVMQSKIPFSYVYELKGIFDTLSASSTDNISALTINFPQVASTSPLGGIVPATIVGLSTTTIGTYLPDGVRTSLLAMQRVSLWLTFAFLVYRRIIPHHVMHTTT